MDFSQHTRPHILVFILALATCLPGFAQVAGFVSGLQFKATAVAGDALLTCNEASISSSVHLQCRESHLMPTEFDHFFGPIDTGATQVELVVKRADGTIRSKVLGYNNKTGLSEGRFNLWMSSVMQKPLFAIGANQVQYRLLQSGRIVAQGQFQASVQGAGSAVCPYKELYSNSSADCDQPYSFCQRYFEERNYCQ